jgi:hypothetical protein
MRRLAGSSVAGATLFAALCAFYHEHECCGGLDGDRVWLACSACGAVLNRCVDDD